MVLWRPGKRFVRFERIANSILLPHSPLALSGLYESKALVTTGIYLAVISRGLEGNAGKNVVGRSNIARARCGGEMNYRISVSVPIYICSGGVTVSPLIPWPPVVYIMNV